MTRVASHRLVGGMLSGHLNFVGPHGALARRPRFELAQRRGTHARRRAMDLMVAAAASHLQLTPAVCNQWGSAGRAAGAGSVRISREIAFFDNFTQSECANLAVHQTSGSSRQSGPPKAASAKMLRIRSCLVLRWAQLDSVGRFVACDALPRERTSLALAGLRTGAKRLGGTRGKRSAGRDRPKAHVPREGFETRRNGNCTSGQPKGPKAHVPREGFETRTKSMTGFGTSKAEGTRSPRGV